MLKKLFILLLTVVVMLSGCSSTTDKGNANASDLYKQCLEEKYQEVGEGSKAFFVRITSKESSTLYYVHSDEKTITKALVALGMVEGSESEYGLYITAINGIVADYDTDGTYWAFYIDGEYASVGADACDIDESKVYEFKIES